MPIFDKLSKLKNPYIVNLFEFGEGPTKIDSEPEESRQYLILDYASKGDFYDYIHYPGGFQERHAKFIFKKILEGVQVCHNSGICHRDLKMENILLDEHFNPKICDFGFATEIKGKDGSGLLEEYLGTENYAAPQMHLNKPYDGVKADIFSLGVILLYLVTGKIGFNDATLDDEYYKYIILEKFPKYWKKVEKMVGKVPEQLKLLYQKMISFNPDERPIIEDIFKHPWMKEVMNLNEKDYKELEIEVIIDFEKREQIINASNGKVNASNDNDYNTGGNKGLDDEEKEYFPLDLRPRYYEKTGLNMKKYMKIVGELNPVKFMNLLANTIVDEYSDRCNIEANEKDLQFKVIFEKEEKEKDEEEENEEEKKKIEEKLNELGIKKNGNFKDTIKPKDSVIQIILLKSRSEGYLIQFEKNGGGIEDYLKNLEGIKKIIKEII